MGKGSDATGFAEEVVYLLLIKLVVGEFILTREQFELLVTDEAEDGALLRADGTVAGDQTREIHLHIIPHLSTVTAAGILLHEGLLEYQGATQSCRNDGKYPVIGQPTGACRYPKRSQLSAHSLSHKIFDNRVNPRFNSASILNVFTFMVIPMMGSCPIVWPAQGTRVGLWEINNHARDPIHVEADNHTVQSLL
jgi:hypothetical protein